MSASAVDKGRLSMWSRSEGISPLGGHPFNEASLRPQGHTCIARNFCAWTQDVVCYTDNERQPGQEGDSLHEEHLNLATWRNKKQRMLTTGNSQK